MKTIKKIMLLFLSFLIIFIFCGCYQDDTQKITYASEELPATSPTQSPKEETPAITPSVPETSQPPGSIANPTPTPVHTATYKLEKIVITPVEFYNGYYEIGESIVSCINSRNCINLALLRIGLQDDKTLSAPLVDVYVSDNIDSTAFNNGINELSFSLENSITFDIETETFEYDVLKGESLSLFLSLELRNYYYNVEKIKIEGSCGSCKEKISKLTVNEKNPEVTVSNIKLSALSLNDSAGMVFDITLKFGIF